MAKFKGKSQGNNKSEYDRNDSRQSSRGKSSNRRRRFDKRAVEESATKEIDARNSKRNDPNWYLSNVMAQAASNLFFSKRFGDPLSDLAAPDIAGTLHWSESVEPQAVAGILRLQTVSTFGEYTNALSSPINIAMQSVFSFIRKANSGSRNYDAPDLMTYLTAVPEVYAFIVYLQRVYGFMNTYYPQNAYFARTLVQAMGVDFDDLLGNSAQFCYFINSLIAKATAFAIPMDFSYIKRKVFMYSNVFIESDNIKDQMYLFTPDGFYFYTVDDSHDEAYLKFHDLHNRPSEGSNLRTVSELIAYGNAMIDALLINEDAGIMSGDVIKAYGLEGLVKLAEMPLNYMLNPVVGDEYIMYQIRNATIVPNYNYPDLAQDIEKLGLNCQPMSRAAGSAWTATSDTATLWLYNSDKLLTSNKSMPGADDVMESTRLMVQFKGFNITSGVAMCVADLICGSEIVTQMAAYVNKAQGSTIYTMKYIMGSNYQPLTGGDAGRKIANISQFRYHPTIFILKDYPNLTACAWQSFMQEIETATTVDRDELHSIHEAAWLNMMAVPSIARLNSNGNVGK